MTPGQPSDALLAKLKQIGGALDDDQIAATWEEVERRRVSFAGAAIICGVVLLAKKESLKHAQWLPWLEQFGGQFAGRISVKLAASLHICEQVTPRACRVYTQVGKHFLADLEQGFAPDVRDSAAVAPAVTPVEVLSLADLSVARQGAVVERIEQWIGGRSLRRMLIDFRRAEMAADQEQAQEAELTRKKAGKPDAPGQMDFWTELARPLTEIDTLMKSEDFIERTTKEGWLKVAEALLAKSKEARAIAATMR